MKKLVYLLSISLIAASCSSQTIQSEAYKRVDNATWDMTLASDKGEPQMIDVRTPEEFAEGNFEGAINIDFYAEDFLEQMEESCKKEERVYIYCRSGGRSAQAAEQLVKAGFTDIVELAGGYSGYPTK